MLGSVEVEAPFELVVPMFLSNWRAVSPKKSDEKFRSFTKNETESGVQCGNETKVRSVPFPRQ